MKAASLIIAASLSLSGCYFLPSEKYKLGVEPVKYVRCWDNMGPNTACGSITVTPDEAEGFIVIVGWKRFEEITDPTGTGKVTHQEMLNRFAEFATKEVTTLGFCKSAVVPAEKQNIMGWESSGDRGIYVVCAH